MPPKKGYKKTPEQIEKTASKHRGMKRSEESRKRMSESAKKKPPVSEETKRKLSESLKGRIFTSEHCANLSKVQIGKKRPPESVAKCAAAHRGMKHTEEARRKMSESHKGENHPNWKGGVSYEPYCVLFNREFKERVRNFYGRKCVECGKTEEQNGNRRLSVHHVNYSKDACCNDGVKPLFVCLCQSCHSKTTTGNREYYEERYTNLINTKYNGQCYLPKVISEA